MEVACVSRSSLKLNREFIKESLKNKRFSYGFLNNSVNRLSNEQVFRNAALSNWSLGATALRVVRDVLDYPMSSTNVSS